MTIRSDGITSGTVRLSSIQPDSFQEIAMANADLKDATALNIGYTVQDKRHEFVLSDPESVRTILDAIQVTSIEPGVQLGLDPYGYVDFQLPDGTVIQTSFVNRTQLDRAHFGQVHLRQSFHEAVCEAASRHAGHPIDVVQDNLV